MKKVTMQNIADLFGVTKVTVSKALNGQDGVSDDLRKKIVKCAKELSYKSSTQYFIPANLSKLAFIVPERYFLENEDFYRVIFSHLNQECLANNISLFPLIIHPDEEANPRFQFLLNDLKPQGLFLAGEPSDEYFEFLTKLNIPAVAIDFYKIQMPVDCVVINNYDAGSDSAFYLVKKGHKKIGFVGDINAASSIADRFFGYLKFLMVKNIPFQEKWVVKSHLCTIQNRYEFDLPDDLPTAFICHCDLAASNLIQKLRQSGMDVPDQVSVISFDNTELSKNHIPPITSFDIDKKSLALKSFQQLLWRIENVSAPQVTIVLSANMIERDSVKSI